MAHEFHTGVFAHGNKAWHRLGEVIDGTLPPREMFERAGALFPVEKLQLWGGDLDGTSIRRAIASALGRCQDLEQNEQIDAIQEAITSQMTSLSETRQAIWRPDEKAVFGTVSPGYEIIQNDVLLKIAESLGDQVEMDAVVVLRKGARVAFTAAIKDCSVEVAPGDSIKRHLVGALGHDGKSGLRILYTDTRVVCMNTLGFAEQTAEKQVLIRHDAFEIAQIDEIIAGIDIARQTLPQVVQRYQALQDLPMDPDEFRQYIKQAYQAPSFVTIEGQAKAVELEELMPRKWAALQQAFNAGLGTELSGVRGTVWGGFNAVTEVESSQLTDGAGKRRIHSSLFGTGSTVIKRARELAYSRC